MSPRWPSDVDSLCLSQSRATPPAMLLGPLASEGVRPRRIVMRNNGNTLLKIKNDSNSLVASNLAPMVPSETTELANAEPNSSAQSNSRLWNVAGSQPLRRSLGEEGAEGVGEPTHF